MENGGALHELCTMPREVHYHRQTAMSIVQVRNYLTPSHPILYVYIPHQIHNRQTAMPTYILYRYLPNLIHNS